MTALPARSTSLAVALASLAFLGCSPGAGQAPSAHANKASKPMTSPISLHLLLSTTELSMAERASFQIGAEATNTSKDVVDPGLLTAVLFVNDVRSPAWDVALGNRAIPTTWEALPAGESISAQWALGPALFPEPGTYSLRLNLGNLNETATVRVVP